MQIDIIAMGNKMPEWVNQGFRHYQKRFSGNIGCKLIEIPLTKRTKGMDTARAIKKEGELMLAAVHPNSLIIALDVKGQRLSTKQLAQEFTKFYQQGQAITLLIGGPEGLDSQCLYTAKKTWSLSDLTLPHPLVRVMLIEALYRAWSLMIGHPYHR